jgi:hypothetical protein
LAAVLADFREGLAASALGAAAGVLAVLAGLADFFALCALDEAVPTGAAFASPEDCAAAGVTSMKNESRPVNVQAANRKPETGENGNLIAPL